jgi:hypothetical protein
VCVVGITAFNERQLFPERFALCTFLIPCKSWCHLSRVSRFLFYQYRDTAQKMRTEVYESKHCHKGASSLSHIQWDPNCNNLSA